MRPARVAAGLIAALAAGCYATPVLAGARIGWVAEVRDVATRTLQPTHSSTWLTGERP